MSTFSIVACDGCGKETDTFDSYSGKSMDDIPKGWGKLYGYDEHYCSDCWGEYCDNHNVSETTGRDFT